MNYKSIVKQRVATVQNVPVYATEMQKALIDKIFFLDKVGKTTVFADYGCANGAVIKLASALLTECKFLGYDQSKEMIEKAIPGPNLDFTSNLEEFTKLIKEQTNQGRQTCLSLLSLIHEVYSYGPENIKDFWDFVFSGMFDYIAVRDMCVSRVTSRPSDPISVAKIRINYDNDLLAQWESTWGSLSENWSLVHFLLTYRYVDSWDREMRENYLPLNLEDLFALVPNTYEPVYMEHYTLPFIRQQAKEDFDIDLQDRTHIKLILRRKA